MTGIINYGAGNIFSLECCLERIGASYFRINDPSEMSKADRFIIPGVGHAASAMEKLQQKNFIGSIQKTDKPLLGICLGMQLLTEWSEEGDTKLLNLIPVKTKRFGSSVKVPHIGWNKVSVKSKHPLFKGIEEEYFYFVHSYNIRYDEEFSVATTEYETTFSSSIGFKNFTGVQFHPEKSGAAGEQLLKNFTELK